MLVVDTTLSVSARAYACSSTVSPRMMDVVVGMLVPNTVDQILKVKLKSKPQMKIYHRSCVMVLTLAVAGLLQGIIFRLEIPHHFSLICLLALANYIKDILLTAFPGTRFLPI